MHVCVYACVCMHVCVIKNTYISNYHDASIAGCVIALLPWFFILLFQSVFLHFKYLIFYLNLFDFCFA